MKISLRERTRESVAVYFEKAGTDEIRSVLPQKARTLEEALEDYQKTLLPGATSYGRTIYAGEKYVGDIWCYGMRSGEEPDGMVSYCIFDKEYRNCGVATESLKLFMKELKEKFGLRTLGAFTYASNIPSVRVLEKNGFCLMEILVEDGIVSKYFQIK